jgi:hypothetical protein
MTVSPWARLGAFSRLVSDTVMFPARRAKVLMQGQADGKAASGPARIGTDRRYHHS